MEEFLCADPTVSQARVLNIGEETSNATVIVALAQQQDDVRVADHVKRLHRLPTAPPDHLTAWTMKHCDGGCCKTATLLPMGQAPTPSSIEDKLRIIIGDILSLDAERLVVPLRGFNCASRI
ncbi:hypothetical protein PpBr36_09080 [Pyricularia pennisetigena]|uniref:hypothetical protein n=1 Tax=Pyricularia pennisetigena TaxID=1578925 RepID=UPI001150445E|nr:hypothetical protein PpBr36_09080 [Pyricularia pennisetigena]TLS24269.1 hypothetical protein PpBr36_09080 [Pyricularia pennisetigena]